MTSRSQLVTFKEKDPSRVDFTSAAYDDMWVKWELPEDLCAGRDRMIEKGRRWLPQEPGEENDSYNVRLNRTFLFGAFSSTIDTISSKPFAKEVTIKNKDRIPDRLKKIQNNVDYQGTDLTAFGKKLFKTAVKYGHTLVYVDFPAIGQNISGGTPLTLGDELEQDIRPYWIHIAPPNLISWRTVFRDGVEEVRQIVYKTVSTAPVGEFGDKVEEIFVQVTAPPFNKKEIAIIGAENLPPEERFGTITKWVESEDKRSFRVISKSFHSFPGVPIVWLPLTPQDSGIFKSSVPFQELAEANLEHWQKGSDNSNILRFVAIAMVLLTGLKEESNFDNIDTGDTSEIKWGVNQIIRGELGADGKYIEHSGLGIASLQKHIGKIEDHMEMLGLQPMIAKQMDVTATAHRKDDQKITSTLQTWIRRLEKVFLELYRISSIWIGEETVFEQKEGDDTNITFDVFNEFGLKVVSRDDADQLLQAWESDALSTETFLAEWQKRGIIGEEIRLKDELNRIKKEKKNKTPTSNVPGRKNLTIGKDVTPVDVTTDKVITGAKQ